MNLSYVVHCNCHKFSSRIELGILALFSCGDLYICYMHIILHRSDIDILIETEKSGYFY